MIEVSLPVTSQPYSAYLGVKRGLKNQTMCFDILVQSKDRIMALVGVDETIDALLEDRDGEIKFPARIIRTENGITTAGARVIGSVFPLYFKGNA